LIISRSARPIAIGVAAGVVFGLIISLLLSKLFQTVNVLDPPTVIGICVLLIFTGLLAAYLPARRAIKLDPSAALRSE
jgi:ABC-type antimicrobial peptide transport system permease subunit